MIFYRYENYGVWINDWQTEERIHEWKFYLVKETPCGWWIHDDQFYNEHMTQDKRWHEKDKPKWVSKTARKRYAYPTQEDALESFKARKKRQIAILIAILHKAEAALAIAESGDLSRGWVPEPIRLEMNWR